jgi:hypothetical protein
MLSMNLILIGLDFITLNLARNRGCHKLSTTATIYYKHDFGCLPLKGLSLQVYELWTLSRIGYFLK